MKFLSFEEWQGQSIKDSVAIDKKIVTDCDKCHGTGVYTHDCGCVHCAIFEEQCCKCSGAGELYFYAREDSMKSLKKHFNREMYQDFLIQDARSLAVFMNRPILDYIRDFGGLLRE